MPSNEIKRQFTLGKMEKDKDDRLVEPGSYRDALNVDVSRSEGDDSGALQVVRGNVEIPNQTIDWDLRDQDCASDDTECIEARADNLTRSGWGETVGVYNYPQEEKVYFFNTGRPVDPDNPDLEQPLQNAIYEFDQTTRTVAPILIETANADYEAGGSATQEFIGEMPDTQVWGKESYTDDTEIDEDAFMYLKELGTKDADQALINLTCSSQLVIERDSDDNPVCRIDGECDQDDGPCGGHPTYQDIAQIAYMTFSDQPNELNIIFTSNTHIEEIDVGDEVVLSGMGDLNNGTYTVQSRSLANHRFIVECDNCETVDPVPAAAAVTNNSQTYDEVTLFFEASNGNYVCRVGGVESGDVCDCSNVGTDNCQYVQLACGDTGGLSRTEEDCRTTTDLPDNISYEDKDNLVLQYPISPAEEFNTSNWTISPDADTSIQYRTITTQDLEREPVCTPKDPIPSDLLGTDFYSLNGNGATLQPEEWCDPRCALFQPDDCTPDSSNNFCYPEYCLKTPVLDSLFDTQLTDAAEEANSNRVVTMTDVQGVNDGDTITARLVRLIPAQTTLTAEFDPSEERYEFTPPTDNGRGVFDADNAVIIRNMDALDFQQFDAIFGNVGLASRPVGYTYRVARNGAVSWVPNSDSIFEAIPDNDAEDAIEQVNPLDSVIPGGGGEGDSLVFEVNVDRQQTFVVDTEDESDNIHDEDDPNYLDDLTR